MGGVDDDDVHAGRDEHVDPLVSVRPGSDRGADAEPTLRVLHGERVAIGLEDVLDRDEADELSVLYDEELLDPVLVEQQPRLVVADVRGDGHELLRHQRAHRLVEVPLEAHVTRGEDADRPVALDHGEPRDRREDHPALRLLHALDLACLIFGRQVLVEDADPALPRHRDRGARLGHRVHRCAHERVVEIDPLAEPRPDVDVLRQHLAVRGDEEDIVERQALAKAVFQHGVADVARARKEGKPRRLSPKPTRGYSGIWLPLAASLSRYWSSPSVNSFETSGSNCVPEQRSISVTATSCGSARRYARSLVIAS